LGLRTVWLATPRLAHVCLPPVIRHAIIRSRMTQAIIRYG